MYHSKQVELMRHHLTREEYAAAIDLGRRELANGRDSSELLVLMASAVLLSDGSCGSLVEVREWLEQAASDDRRNVDASLELARFLDAVVDEQGLAARSFELTACRALEYLEGALAGLSSVGAPDAAIRQRIRALLQSHTQSSISIAAVVKRALLGRTLRAMQLGHGSILLVDFGASDGELKAPTTDIHLRVECAWSLETSDTVLIASEDDRGSLKTVLAGLALQGSVVGVEVSIPAFRLRIELQGGYSLNVFPVYANESDCENWVFHLGDGQVVIAGPGRLVQVAHGNDPST